MRTRGGSGNESIAQSTAPALLGAAAGYRELCTVKVT
jgi:hypothetical protein